ncbi:MAG TPA: LamG domain-containing protein, partial [Candidatus Marinimicrobia bacterium]|nr:LamG domain-containing protein [Candidatus Neomarinimicrobiota bacterium]
GDNSGSLNFQIWEVGDQDPPPSDGNHSLSFDGVDDYADFGVSNDFAITQSNSATIMMWVKPNSNGFLLSKYENFNAGNSNFFISVEPSGGPFRVTGNGTNVLDFGMPVMDAWQHIALVFDPGEPVQAFIDGLLVGSGNINLSPTASDRPMLMGQPMNLADTDDYLNAHLDEVLFWNTALTQSQIQSYMTVSPTGNESGLVGYWNFNEGSGSTLTDQTSNGNDGTINGATWSDDSPILGCTDPLASNYDPDANIDDGSCAYPNNGDYSLSFDGVDDYVDMGDVLDQSNSFTISTWVYVEESGQFGIASKRVNTGSGYFGWDIVIDGNQIEFVVFENTSPGVTVTGQLELNQWNHYVGVYEAGTSVKLFIDGELIDENTNSVPSSLSNNDASLLFGSLQTAGIWPFKGKIDEFVMWDYALTESEIQSYMSSSPSGNETGLIGYWNFNEGTGTTLTDQTSNSNNGTIVGATWSTDVPPLPSLTSITIDGTSGYRFLSSPVSGAIYGDFLDELWTQGMAGSDDPNNGGANVWTWNNSWNALT